MQWVIVAGFLVTLVGCGGGSVIKCTPESQHGPCSENTKIDLPPPDVSSKDSPRQVECLGGSEWESNCHYCRCSDSGVAECLKRETCENGVFDLPPPDVSSKDSPRQVECLGGSEWESNCHYCRCSDSGVAECLKRETCDNGVFAEPLQCKPNTTFQRDCNTCVCLENGLALCTIEFCRRTGIPKKSELLSGKDCAPGSSWKDRCNDCRCSDAGYGVCNVTFCEEQATGPEMRCAPDTVWRNDCNTCWCTTQGRAMCTKIGCVAITNYNKKEDSETSNDQEFTGPKQKAKVYNKHRQEDNRINSVESKDFHNVIKRSVCKPNQDFESECNSCKCSADGQHYTCTQNECLEKDMTKEVEVFMESEGVDHIERHSVCKPRDTFYVGCNTCHCNFDGTDYSCTNKPCPLPDDVELFHELKITKSSKNNTNEVICVANRMFIKDCNTCWCNDDGTSYFCTRKVCIPDLPDEPNPEEEKPEELRIIKKECRPDEVFELDCNMCRCNPDGKSFSCTRRACVDQEDVKNSSLSRKVRATPQLETGKNCQPGQEFRLDCNSCLCDNEGLDFSCTRIDCNNNNGGARSKREVGDLKEIPAECTPGSVFQQDCDACRCTNDGHHALCTTRQCQKEVGNGNNLDSNVHNTESDPGFRCTPGEQLRRDCNDCTCAADGKSIFCTLRLCDQDITPGV